MYEQEQEGELLDYSQKVGAPGAGAGVRAGVEVEAE